MRSYPVKENPIGSAVSEIFRYKQTDRHRPTLYYRYDLINKKKKSVSLLSFWVNFDISNSFRETGHKDLGDRFKNIDYLKTRMTILKSETLKLGQTNNNSCIKLEKLKNIKI